MLLALAVGAVLLYLGLVLVFAYDICEVQDCSYNGFMSGWLLASIAPALVLIIAGTAAIVRLVRRKRAWWIPLVGIVLAVLLWWVGAQIVFWSVPGASF